MKNKNLKPMTTSYENQQVLADIFGGFTDKLLKPKTKSPIEASAIVEYTDDLGRTVEIFYRVIDGCINAQTDESTELYTIEQVIYKERVVHLTKEGERTLYEWLYRTNPSNCTWL